jgi:hypothetical protein
MPATSTRRATDRQLRDALYSATEQAWEHYHARSLTPDGHHLAGVRVVPGLRISVRISRLNRTEVSVSSTTKNPIDPALIERLDEAHRSIQGAPLDIAYSEPRDAARRGAPVMWAVMHVGAANVQPALGLGR